MNLRLATLLLACALPVMVAGQEVVCTPFDNNGDNIVGIGDLIDLLARFGDSDLDQDGIWDSADDCVGAYDTCGVCNGPGPQVLAIDTIIINGLYRDTVFHFVCENPGCTDPLADNFDPYAEEGGLCTYLSCFGPNFDGYNYDAVEIGTQCWFAENLRTTVYANGDLIPTGLTTADWNTETIGATAVYGEGNSSCFNYSSVFDICDEIQTLAAYGRLYNWYAVDDGRGLCPTGWHVPSIEDWTELRDYIVSQGFSLGTEGGALKSTSGWDINDGIIGINGTDNFGFSAVPGGKRSEFGFFSAGDQGKWSAAGQANVWGEVSTVELSNIWTDLIFNSYASTHSGVSVRCLRDSE